MRARIAVSAAIGLASGAFCWFLMTHFHQDAADFRWAIRLAQRLLARQNPYDTPYQLYPVPAALFGLPFVRMQPELAAGIFWGISSALLAFGLTRESYTGLLIFFAYPYWAGILTAQWIPLIMASAFFPLLLPVTMAKPQIGLPVFLTRLTFRGFLACAVVGIASLILVPNWPVTWLRYAASYQRFVPLFVLPGPLLALALLRYRNRDAIFLFLSSIMPQRWFYDAFILWLISRTRRQIVWTVFLSWGAGLWRWYHAPQSFTQVGHIAVIFLYLPMLVVVLLSQNPNAERNSSSSEARA